MQTATSNLSPGAARWIRISAIITMLVVAISSAVLSFDGLQKLALASQVPGHLAFLFPIAVDMTILMGSLAVLLYEMFGLRARFGWFTVLFGTGLSVTGNVISVADSGLIAQVLHGIIPILLCISLESLLRILRFNIRRGQDDVSSIHEEPEYENRREAENTQEPVEAIEAVTNEKVAAGARMPPVAPDASLTDAQEVSASIVEPKPVEEVELVQRKVLVPAPAPTVRDTENITSPKRDSGDEWLANARTKLNEMENMPTHRAPFVEAPVAAVVPSVASEGMAIDSTISPSATETKVSIVRDPVAAHQRERLERPVAERSEKSTQAKNPDTKTPKKRAPSVVPPLEDYEREDFKTLIDAMPEDTPAVQKLGSVFKVKDTMPAADVRWLLGYEDGKRVDSLMRRARDWAATN